jgi:hypothetical protein
MQGVLDPDRPDLQGVIPKCGEQIMQYVHKVVADAKEKRRQEEAALAAAAAAGVTSVAPVSEEPSFALYMQVS